MVDQTLQVVVLLLTKARRHAIGAARIADLDPRACAERPDIVGGEPREDIALGLQSLEHLPERRRRRELNARVVRRQHGGHVRVQAIQMRRQRAGSRQGRLQDDLIAFTAAHQSQYGLHALRRGSNRTEANQVNQSRRSTSAAFRARRHSSETRPGGRGGQAEVVVERVVLAPRPSRPSLPPRGGSRSRRSWAWRRRFPQAPTRL